MDQDFNQLLEGMKLLKQANDNLKRIQNDYKDDPELLSIYEPSALKLVNMLKDNLNKYLEKNNLLTISIKPDFWIRLQGKSFEDGRAPLGVVGAFLQKLIIANQHAVSILENIKYDGGRFNKRVKELAEFDLVATAAGSLKIGLKKPLPTKFLNIDDDTFVIDEVYKELLNQANKDCDKSIEGIELLAKAIESADDESKLEELKKEIVNPKDMLRLLYYASEIAPSSSSDIEEITIINEAKISKREIHYNCETRNKLRKISDEIVKNEKYVEGTGIAREVDLDKLTFRISNFKTDNIIIDDLQCKLDKDNDEKHKLKELLDTGAKFSGVLIYSKIGQIKHMEVDKIYIIGEND